MIRADAQRWRIHFFNRTPGPPFVVSPVSRKTTPACSSARRTDSTFAAVLADGPRSLSIRRIVGVEIFVTSASFG